MAWDEIKQSRRRLSREQGAILKDWGGRISVALIYPNSYYLGMSNLGFQTIYGLLKKNGPQVLVLRRKCALVQGREGGFPYDMQVNQDKCLGEECGCGRYCTRIFRCPGLIWDKEVKKAKELVSGLFGSFGEE